MSKPEQVNCDVEFGSVDRLGLFANAFRILKDTGDEFFLDFLTYSISENRAALVVRLRITKTLIPAMHQRLSGVLQELGSGVPVEPVASPVILVPHDEKDKLN